MIRKAIVWILLGAFGLAGTAWGDYCTASGTGYYEYITDVVVGDIVNTGTGCDHYTDYTAMSTDMQIGTGYEITVVNGRTLGRGPVRHLGGLEPGRGF